MQSHLKIFVFVTVISAISCAKYDGVNESDAGKYIDNSHGVIPFGFSQPGHPRGHVAETDTGKFSINSVQDYSRDPNSEKYGKSGFLTKQDQDAVLHIALKHPKAQAELAKLNKGQKRVILELSAAELENLNKFVGEWKNGERVNYGMMRSVVLVLGHFKGQEKNPDFSVHIQTAYPKISSSKSEL